VLNGAGKDASTANFDGALRYDSQSTAASFNSPVQLQTDSHVYVDGNLTPVTGPATYGQLTLAQTVSGSGGLTVDGPGILVLATANSYGDATTVSAGSNLLVTNTTGSATSTGQVTVDGLLGGSGIISGPVSFGGGTLEPSAFGTPSTLTLGTTTFSDAAASATFSLGAPGTVGSGVNDLTVINGNLALDGTLNVTGLSGFGVGTYELFSYTGTESGTFALGALPAGFNYSIVDVPGGVNGGVVDLQVTPLATPEPSSIVLTAIGSVALTIVALHRRRAKQHRVATA
jgi:autotransporter-associated beta strand protein